MHRQQSAAHMRHHDLEPRIAVEQPGQDHARQRHGGVERPTDQLVELELIHLLLVPDRHPRRMDEERHLRGPAPIPRTETPPRRR